MDSESLRLSAISQAIKKVPELIHRAQRHVYQFQQSRHTPQYGARACTRMGQSSCIVPPSCRHSVGLSPAAAVCRPPTWGNTALMVLAHDDALRAGSTVMSSTHALSASAYGHGRRVVARSEQTDRFVPEKKAWTRNEGGSFFSR